VACLIEGAGAFLAGRLDAPVGYRNGSAALFAMAFWPLLVVAAHRRAHVLVRAGAFAVALVALGLALLTQSRGVLIGFAVGGAVALLLGPDRLRRAWLAILAVALLALAGSALLEPYDAFIADGVTDPAAVDSALGALALLGTCGFGVALVLAVFDGGLRVSQGGERRLRTFGIGGLTALALAALVAGAAAVGDPLELARDKAAEFKELDAPAPGETRLGSTGGQRYDLWQIAWHEFKSAPLTGVGEGSYPTRYYLERATDRNLTTPHSLPLRVLAETGLVGLLLLGGALAAAAVALGRSWRTASDAQRRWASAMVASAAVLFSQSSVDWLWQIPGLTGLGMLCLGTGVAAVAVPRDPAPARARPWHAARAVPVLAAVLVGVLFVSYTYMRSAREPDVPSAERLSLARSAQRLDPWALAPRYLQAGALEELGRRGEARRTLLEALDVAPADFSTMALLGDLETRAGDPAAARAWYRRALARNPRDVGLQELAR
jgi:O-antigen ligase